jgi:hypothetical protein
MSMTMTAMGEIFKGSVTNENHLSPTPLRLPLRLGYLSTTP